MHNQQIAHFYKLKELRIFLQRIIKRNIILQSNFKKGIDRDLLIIQQTRNLKTKLKQIDNETRNYELKLKNETKQSKSKAGKLRLKYLRNQYKEHYIKKFDFLFRKQKN